MGFWGGLGDADTRAVDIHNRLFGGVRDSRNRPLVIRASFHGTLVKRQTRAGANGEEQGALTEIGLVAVALNHDAGAAIIEQALEKFPGGHSFGAIVAVLTSIIIKDIAAKSKGPTGEAGGIDAQLVAHAAFSGCAAKGWAAAAQAISLNSSGVAGGAS